MNPDSKRITFLFSKAGGFSGQRLASETLINGLRQRGWTIDEIHAPALERQDRSARGVFWIPIFFFRLFKAWWQGIMNAHGPGFLYVNLGQTVISMVREGFPLLVRGMFLSKGRSCIVLHGSLFMSWRRGGLKAILLRAMARAVSFVTVLGPSQREQLIALGIPQHKVVIVDNTCNISPVHPKEIEQKHRAKGPVRVLFLSALWETKGFPEYVEAISRLADQDAVSLEATLCGPTVESSDNPRFPTHDKASVWIQRQVEGMGGSKRVQLTWIPGATGEAKENLFREAQIFVLPSHYKVEAQPLVLLEALASGCAIITTRVGEIPSTVSSETAVLLDEATPTEIANVISDLAGNPGKRLGMATSGLALFHQRFSITSHLDQWEALVGQSMNCCA